MSTRAEWLLGPKLAGWLARDQMIERDVEPLEGTRMSLFNSQIPDWWGQNGLSTSSQFLPGNAILAERVWTAERCQQMNAQQIASMPLVFHGSPDVPAWVSSPDPNWYPNGIGDALHSIVEQMYGWGFAILYVTDVYADGFPRTWTVLQSGNVSITAPHGARVYKLGDVILDPTRVVQIDRNPGTGLHGCSALRAYAQQAWSLLAAGNQSMSVSQGAMPKVWIRSEKKLREDQAQAVQAKWMAAAANRGGAPPIVDPSLTPNELSFNPSDLSLLETQEWNARTIASAYGVPSVLLNMALQGGLTYQNPAALGEMWWRFELRPTATKVANAFSAQLLPRGQWVSFDAADTFLPLDTMSDDNDEQLSQVASASPAQQPLGLSAVSG
jgi:HK97 family phage portal protein